MNAQLPSPSSPVTNSAQDPLAQLQDIHLPAEIGLWPPAWGWWLLLIILISAVSALIFFIRRKKTRNAYRGVAITELNNIRNQFGDEQTSEYLQALSIILRRTALSGFGAQFNPSLKGDDWLRWLDEQCQKTRQQFSDGVGKVLLTGPYQKSPEFDRAALHQLAALWVNEHRNQWQKTNSKKINLEAARHV